MRIGPKLTLTVAIVAVAASALLGGILTTQATKGLRSFATQANEQGLERVTREGEEALARRAAEQLVSAREFKRMQVEELFQTFAKQVQAMAANRMVADAVQKFSTGFDAVGSDLGIGPKEIAATRGKLARHYEEHYLNMVRAVPGYQRRPTDQYLPADPNAILLHGQYIHEDGNPNKVGEKENLIANEEFTGYNAAHALYHPALLKYLRTFGYYDIFLVREGDGQIIYTVYKEKDFATSLVDGPYAKTNLGEAFRLAKQAGQEGVKDFVGLVEMAPYEPSYNDPALFVSAPVFAGHRFAGVLIFQIPVSQIDAIMLTSRRWDEVGLGDTGETYLVGRDFTLRSSSRRDASGTTSVLTRVVRNPATEAALKGESGSAVVEGYDGEPVLSAYAPLDVLGLRMAVLAEMEEREAMGAVAVMREISTALTSDLGAAADATVGRMKLWLAALLGATLALALAAGAWLARSFVRPLTMMVGAVDLLAGGDLAVRVAYDSRDEIGRLATGFNGMVERLRATITDTARIKTALDGAATNVMMCDRAGRIIYANRRTVDSLRQIEAELQQIYPGFQAGSLVGMDIDTFHRNPEAIRRLIADPSRLPYSTQIHVGALVLDLTVGAVVDEAGDYIATVVEWEDVTERVHIEEGSARLVAGVTEGHLDYRIDTTQFVAVDYQHQAQRLNEMLDTIVAPLRQIITLSEQVAQSATEIATGNQDLASRTEEQAASLQETAAAMEEMAATTQSTADRSGHANELSQKAREVAERGEGVVNRAVEAMVAINQSSTRIKDIIEVIDEIAFQTNLLSLNAAVEAARAGEQGRGFAVVAAEVRNLARRSAKAAQEIKALIQDSVAKVGAGTDLVNASGGSLKEILTAVGEVSAIISEISHASVEQSAGIDSVNGAISQMNTITQQNAALVEEVAASAASLNDRAREMKAQLDHFHLGAGHPAAGRRPAAGAALGAPRAPVEILAAKGATGEDEWQDF